MIDIRLLTFLTLAKNNSYTKTAEILRLTQPAISQHMKYLEDEYGVKLTKKYGRGFKLTEEGNILYRYAEEIEELYKKAENKLKNKTAIIKNYSLGATMTLGGYVLPSILSKYKKLHENINIQLQVNNTSEILEKLIAGKIDFALVEGTFNKNKFKFSKFKDDELILAVAPKHEFAKRSSVTMEEILNGHLILREEGSGTRKVFENRLAEIEYDLMTYKPYMEIGSITAIKALIKENIGYSVISKETVQLELKRGSIKYVPIKNFRILREFNFVYLYGDDFINDFIKFCAAEQ
ncbi:LysR family transcriptional regulator [Clostridium oryzae]|uniref:HTH-type transcriptional regulator CysL n=1 Tax=Clostridium oryzae TaxID=1450648 RepID=A0A1V4I5I5_9CLOT|nr:LysR family transcriptional regulator [Clostridium oryzae]OPJ54837.1 HTH-type transcriptional regulator CysL [Clostridium oryzae]